MAERPRRTIRPTALIVDSIFAGIFFLVIISMSIISVLPPSRAGRGRRFITPRFMLISAVILSSDRAPAFAAVPIASEIPTGPETAAMVYLPVIRSIMDSQHILTMRNAFEKE